MTYGATQCSFCHARAEFRVMDRWQNGAPAENAPACALHLGDVLRADRTETAAGEWKVMVVP